MAEAIHAALVGAGLVGQVAHLQTLTAPDSPIRLAAMVDASPTRAAALGAAHHVPHATSLEGLGAAISSTLDAVVIAAPDPAHHDLAITALGMGLHVFIEKPLALTPAEGRAIQAAVAASGRVCQVVQ
jgi:predicted dehydrogenase